MVCSDFYDFKGKTVLITGASSGLGERFATILSSAGAKVILAARRKDKLQEVAGKIKNAAIIQLDVANPGSVKEAFEKINKENEQVEKLEVNFKTTNPTSFRYLKVVAKTLGELPEWHLGAEHQGSSWIFADEILINE